MAIRSGVSAKPPTTSSVLIRPSATEPKKTSAPRAAGAITAKRISSSVQAIGWKMATTTAVSVRASITSRNVRLPKPWPSGTLIAM